MDDDFATGNQHDLAGKTTEFYNSYQSIITKLSRALDHLKSQNSSYNIMNAQGSTNLPTGFPHGFYGAISFEPGYHPLLIFTASPSVGAAVSAAIDGASDSETSSSYAGSAGEPESIEPPPSPSSSESSAVAIEARKARRRWTTGMRPDLKQ